MRSLIFIVLPFMIFSCSKKETLHPKRGPIVEAVYGLGTVKANRTFTLKVGVSMGVREVFVVEGEQVKPGQALAAFDNGSVQRSPIAGTVTRVDVKPAETVFPQTPLIEVTDLKDRYISVALEQRGALRIRSGQKAILSFESLPGQKFAGEVESIFPSEGQFLVRIRVADLRPEVLPGMTADLAIEVGRKDNALLIPVKALSTGKAVVHREGKTLKVDVKIGVMDGLWAEVLEGDIRDSDELVAVKSGN